MDTEFPKGSEWRKWDLHVHSPASYLNNQFGDDWDAYVSILFRKVIAKEIWAIGITDYFTIDGYKKLKKEYIDNPEKLKSLFNSDEIEKIARVLILPNIEFRLNKFVGENSINFHVIFSEEATIQEIEEDFLHEIDFVYEGTPQNTEEKYKLKINNLVALGKKLKEQHDKFKDKSDLKVGMMNAVVNDEDISKILINKPSKFRGKFLMGVVADEDLSLINWNSKDHQTRKVLIQKSDFLLSSNSKTRQWALGKEPYAEGEKNFIKEFKTLKPCIHGSDAHKADEIGHPCIHRGETSHNCVEHPESCDLRYCWIKADTTFEGLRQLLYEPSERILIQDANPTPLKSNYTINIFKLNGAEINTDLSFDSALLHLNEGLVAVTGSKGSGKTALVDLIANCYIDRCNTDDKNSFVRRISDQGSNLAITLVYKDGASFTKTLTQGTFFKDSPITYIAQAELERYIGDESDLNEYIRHLIFDSPKVKDSVKSFEFSNLLQNIEDLQRRLRHKNRHIESYEFKTGKEQTESLNMIKIRNNAELKDLSTRIYELEKIKKEDKIKLAYEKQRTLSGLKDKKDKLINLRELLKSNIQFIEDEIPIFNENIEQINSLLSTLSFDRKFANISYQEIDELRVVLADVNDQIVTAISDIEKFQTDLDLIEASVKVHTKLLDRKRELEIILADLEKKITEIESNKTRLISLIGQRKETLKELIKTILSLKAIYEEIINQFSAQKGSILSDLNFIAEMIFYKDTFLSSAEDILDNRKININETFEKLFSIIDSLTAIEDDAINEYVKEIERLQTSLKTKIKRSKAITMQDYNDFLYNNYFTIIPSLKYKNTALNKLSLGQKATVLIKIYLAHGDKPIIIDSHDDHLDNEFIMDELVVAIREAKKHRQIVLVSNNGNVVINSDSEQIIIANRNDIGQISYTSGSIENPSIRKRALVVLEGGSEAFKKRQQKYRMNDTSDL